MHTSTRRHHRLLLASLVVAVPLWMLAACEQQGADNDADQSAGETSKDTEAETETAQRPAPPAGPPQLQLVASSHDFGTINEVDTVTCAIEFTNTGGSTLNISTIKSSCGCATTEISSYTYEPGESGTIDIEFTPQKADRTNPKTYTRKVVTIVSDSGGEQGHTERFTIQAHVEPFVTIDPQMLLFGQQPLGLEYKHLVTVSTELPILDIIAVEDDGPDATVRVLSDEEAATLLPPGANSDSTKILEVLISADAPWGGQYFGIEITSNVRSDEIEAGKTHTSTLRVGGELFGEIVAKPNRFAHGTRDNTAVELEVLLTRVNRAPLTITSATFNPEDILTPDVQIGYEQVTNHVWRVTLSTVMKGRSIRGAVRVRTNVQGAESVIDIPVQVLLPRGR